MSSSVRPPLTRLELERRAAALKASSSNCVTSDASDARLYGQRAAAILRDCKRDVALASHESRFAGFEAAAETLSAAAADQWLPKAIIADRLQEIADAHHGFGKSLDEIQLIISNAVAKVDIPPVVLPAKASKRRLISRQRS